MYLPSLQGESHLAKWQDKSILNLITCLVPEKLCESNILVSANWCWECVKKRWNWLNSSLVGLKSVLKDTLIQFNISQIKLSPYNNHVRSDLWLHVGDVQSLLLFLLPCGCHNQFLQAKYRWIQGKHVFSYKVWQLVHFHL